MMYVSKVWGFDVPSGPLVFSSRGWRDNAVAKLKSGDRVILVGTLGEDTAEPDRNRILGMMEPSTVHVSTSDFPMPHQNDQRLFKEDGSFRWPFGLLNYRAWKFEPGLFLADAAPRTGNDFGSVAASGIVPLTNEEESRILAHPHYEIPLLRSVNSDQKLYGDDVPRRRGAPPPTEAIRQGIMHMRSEPAFVYWFRLELNGKIVGHKIGWAFDWETRLRQFNLASLHKLGGIRYTKYQKQRLMTARLAYGVEQDLFRVLDKHRHPSNREVLTGLSTAKIDEVWHAHITAGVLGKRLTT